MANNNNNKNNEIAPSTRRLYNVKANQARRQAEFENARARMCAEGECPVVPHSCPEGEVLREGYIRRAYNRKNGTHVNEAVVMPECIVNRGKPGKQGPSIIIRKNKELGHFGYHDVKDMDVRMRHMALGRAVKALGARMVMENLRALVNLRAGGTDPEGRKIFQDDLEWVYVTYPVDYKTAAARERQQAAMAAARAEKNN